MAKKSRDADVATEASAPNDSGRFKSSVLVGAMLFAPAAFLVLRGNLSVNEALIRFGCALLFAMVGSAIIVSSMPSVAGSSPAGRTSGGPDGDALASDGATVNADHGPGLAGGPVTQPVG